MGIFDGISEVGGRVQLPYLRTGRRGDEYYTRSGGYLLTLQRLEAFENKDGQGRVSAEFTVTQVTSGTDASHAEGSLVKELWSLDRNPKGLTNRGKADMFRMRNFFSAVFAQAGIEVTNENIQSLVEATCEATQAGTDDSIVGIQVLCDVFEEASRSKDPKFADNMYATTRFSAPPTV